MSTTNTDNTWYWYIRKKDKNYYLGLIDNNGDAPDTADLDIEIWYDKLPADVDADGDSLEIPIQFELGFVKGCVYELLLMYGKNRLDLKDAYEKTIYDATAYQVRETQQPMLINPINMRDD